MEHELRRCDWALGSTLEREYHDKEWGRPVHDDRHLFRMLILEGMQAGLSWKTILAKRQSMEEAFDGFDPAIIINYGDEKVEELMQNKGIIRNRLKIQSVITNAKAYFEVVENYGSFDAYLWRFVGGAPIINTWESMEEIPSKTELSDRMSKEMKKDGFKFVGSTIVYAFMQSTGMVNDHLISCAFYKSVSD